MSTTLGVGMIGHVKQAFYLNSPTKIPLAMKMLPKNKIIKLAQIDHVKAEN